MKFEDIVGKKIVIEFNNDSEKEEFKQWCIDNDLENYEYLDNKWNYYRVDNSSYLQGTKDKLNYIVNNYQIINYKDFSNINNISFKDLFTKYSVHCDTEDKAIKFLQLCEDNNIVWNSGSNALKKKIFMGMVRTLFIN